MAMTAAGMMMTMMTAAEPVPRRPRRRTRPGRARAPRGLATTRARRARRRTPRQARRRPRSGTAETGAWTQEKLAYAWTGVGLHGEPDGGHCEAWSTAYFKYSGQVGQISPVSDSDADVFDWKIDGHWVKYTSLLCATKTVHLYCFEQ
jgi:hypothetical protein